MSSQSHRGTVLVSGAGVAGPLLAHWLDRAGFAVVLVERAAARREEGQNVDVRGAGREVLRRTGSSRRRSRRTRRRRAPRSSTSAAGPRAVLPAAQGESDGATAELEILRGKLSGLLLDLPAERTERVFGDHVTGLDDHGDGVTVTWPRATSARSTSSSSPRAWVRAPATWCSAATRSGRSACTASTSRSRARPRTTGPGAGTTRWRAAASTCAPTTPARRGRC